MTRSVRDSALLLDATQGEEVGSLFRIAPPERSYLSELESDSTRAQAVERLYTLCMFERVRRKSFSSARVRGFWYQQSLPWPDLRQC